MPILDRNHLLIAIRRHAGLHNVERLARSLGCDLTDKHTWSLHEWTHLLIERVWVAVKADRVRGMLEARGAQGIPVVPLRRRRGRPSA